MKNFFQFDIKFILILLLGGILLFKNCSDKEKDEKQTYTLGKKKYELLHFKIDTITNIKNNTVYVKGDDMIIDTIKHDTIILQNIDTLSVVKDYFTKYIYRDSLSLDSVGYVKTTDTITQNKILNRKWEYSVKEKTITKEVILKDLPKRQLYFGFNTSLNRTNIFNSVGGGIIYKDKQDKIYQLNIGLGTTQNTTISPFIGGGLYWKLHMKKD